MRDMIDILLFFIIIKLITGGLTLKINKDVYSISTEGVEMCKGIENAERKEEKEHSKDTYEGY